MTLVTRTHYEICILEDGRRSGVPILPYDLLAEATEHAERIAQAKNLPIIHLAGNERIADLGKISAVVVETVVMRTAEDGIPRRVFEVPRQAPNHPFTEVRLPG